MKNMIYTLPEGKNVNEMAHAIQMYLAGLSVPVAC